ncbi:MAG TPA: BTAD domain-containing putative transcriptional regulator [Longimicrobiales bacterium]
MSARLRTLGGLSLDLGDPPATGRATQRKRLALLALLAAARNGGLSRDKIIAYLWPERDTEQSRHALSQALYALRRELGDTCIVAGIDELCLDHEQVPSDVAQLNAAIASGDLTTIAALHTGPFLDGFHLPDAPEFEEWVAQRRAEYERAYTAALDELAARALANGDARRAVGCLQQRAAVDPLNSEVALRLMRARAAAGDRAGALRHFRTHAALLREELQIEPDAELAAFAAACSHAQPDHRHAPVPQAAAAAPPEPARPRRRIATRARVAAALAVTAVLVFAIAVARGGRDDVTSQVVLAAVSGPDTALSMAVREALRAELEQSDGARVLGDAVSAHTLELMRLPPSTLLDEQRALEVAHRRGVPYVITASVQPVGTGAQIVVRLLDVARDRVVATVTRRPNREQEVLGAVGSIAADVRERVTRMPARTTSPLPAVTTASLPALRNYALARHALSSWDRQRALELLEAALVHDSSFALAHYLAGDLLWYIDKQRHSDEHMERAVQLAERLPPREQLIVRARYQQLVRDEPDSALVYWKLLADSYPDEPLAYEGLRWAYRALGRTREMAEASARGARYDGAQRRNAYYDRLTLSLQSGDSAGAMEASLHLENPQGGLLLWLLGRNRLPPPALLRSVPPNSRHAALLIAHRFDEAAVQLDSMRSASLQWYPRALLAQARMEWAFAPSARARACLARVLTWIENADLSPPAYARLAERTAELAARMNDRDALRRLRNLIDQQDRGRDLRSYRIARSTLDAADAFMRGDFATAAQASIQYRDSMFYARSNATVLLLHADALAAGGRRADARRILQQLAEQRVSPDGDMEILPLIAHIAAARLAALQEAS